MDWAGSDAGLALAIRLSQLRSAVRVGLALATVCPTEDAWEALMQQSDVQETLSEFATIADDMTENIAQASPERALDQVMLHHARALEALEPFCESLGLDPEDLLVILTA